MVKEEVDEKKVAGLVLEGPDQRSELLEMLDRVIEECYKKFKGRYCRNTEKLSWARVLALLAKVSNELLRDVEIEGLAERVEKIEEMLKR
jgi:hypothetical protein